MVTPHANILGLPNIKANKFIWEVQGQKEGSHWESTKTSNSSAHLAFSCQFLDIKFYDLNPCMSTVKFMFELCGGHCEWWSTVKHFLIVIGI